MCSAIYWRVLELIFLFKKKKMSDHEKHFRKNRSFVGQLLNLLMNFKICQGILPYPVFSQPWQNLQIQFNLRKAYFLRNSGEI